MRRQRVEPPQPGDELLPGDPQLDVSLRRTLAKVGPDGYAAATARHFAPGGKFNPKRKQQRFAIT